MYVLRTVRNMFLSCLENAHYASEFTCKGAAVGFRTNDSTCNDWARYYLNPYFSLNLTQQTFHERFTFAAYFDKMLFSRTSALIKKLNVKNEIQTYLNNRGICYNTGVNGSFEVIGNEKDSYSIYIDLVSRNIILLSDHCSKEGILESSRIIRDIFTKHFEQLGYVVLHSGAVTTNLDGIVFVGGKNAGKTTCVISFISCVQAGYMANDKTYVGITDGTVLVHGWPTTCSIALGTVHLFPELGNFIESTRGLRYPQSFVSTDNIFGGQRKVEITPAELSRIFSVEIVPEAKIRCLVFPNLLLEKDEVKIQELRSSEVCSSLEKTILTPNDPHYPDWLNLRSLNTVDLASKIEEIKWHLANNVPSIKITVGNNPRLAVAEMIKYLDRL